jgi:hypothetical protein
VLRSFLLALLLTAIAATGATAAHAEPRLPSCADMYFGPDQGVVLCDDSDPAQVWDYPTDPWGACDGFYIVATYQVTRMVTDWWTRAIVQVSYEGTLSNSSDPSKSVPYSGRFSKHIDYTTDPLSIRRSGVTTRVEIPHSGAIFHEGGTEVFDAFHHGPIGDMEALCAALS